MRRMVIPTLIIACIIILLYLLFDKSFQIKKLWYIGAFYHSMKHILLRFLICGTLLGMIVYFFNEQFFFAFPKRNLKFWSIVMLLYPLLSVYPQELIYRVFFFHRYNIFFSEKWILVLASGICFGLAHLFFLSFWAVILSTFGGVMFAYTYSKTESVILTSLEHGLWGDLIFTIGLGIYFYSGNI